MSMFFKDSSEEVDFQRTQQPNVLDLALPKGSNSAEKVEPPSHILQQNAAAAFLAAQALLPKVLLFSINRN